MLNAAVNSIIDISDTSKYVSPGQYHLTVMYHE